MKYWFSYNGRTGNQSKSDKHSAHTTGCICVLMLFALFKLWVLTRLDTLTNNSIKRLMNRSWCTTLIIGELHDYNELSSSPHKTAVNAKASLQIVSHLQVWYKALNGWLDCCPGACGRWKFGAYPLIYHWHWQACSSQSASSRYPWSIIHFTVKQVE